MINREDMMELTRRMTLSRTSMTRIAGAYMDSEGFIFPAFKDRSEDWNFIDVFQANENRDYRPMLKFLGVI